MDAEIGLPRSIPRVTVRPVWAVYYPRVKVASSSSVHKGPYRGSSACSRGPWRVGCDPDHRGGQVTVAGGEYADSPGSPGAGVGARTAGQMWKQRPLRAGVRNMPCRSFANAVQLGADTGRAFLWEMAVVRSDFIPQGWRQSGQRFRSGGGNALQSKGPNRPMSSGNQAMAARLPGLPQNQGSTLQVDLNPRQPARRAGRPDGGTRGFRIL